MTNRIYLLFLLLLIATPLVEANDSKSVIAVFREYVSLNRSFTLSVGTKYENKNRRLVETYMEGPFQQALGAAERIFCSGDSTALAEELIDVMLATTNSASEAPSSTLGRMFICRPEVVASVLRSQTGAERDKIYALLKFGFENEAYGVSTEDLAPLKVRLDELRPEGQ